MKIVFATLLMAVSLAAPPRFPRPPKPAIKKFIKSKGFDGFPDIQKRGDDEYGPSFPPAFLKKLKDGDFPIPPPVVKKFLKNRDDFKPELVKREAEPEAEAEADADAYANAEAEAEAEAQRFRSGRRGRRGRGGRRGPPPFPVRRRIRRGFRRP